MAMLDGEGAGELEGPREFKGRKDGAGGLPVLALVPVKGEGEGDACVRDVEHVHAWWFECCLS